MLGTHAGVKQSPGRRQYMTATARRHAQFLLKAEGGTGQPMALGTHARSCKNANDGDCSKHAWRHRAQQGPTYTHNFTVDKKISCIILQQPPDAPAVLLLPRVWNADDANAWMNAAED
jgi:hypothetical protein